MSFNNVIARIKQYILSESKYRDLGVYILNNFETVKQLSATKFMKKNAISQFFLQDFLQSLGIVTYEDFVMQLKECDGANWQLPQQDDQSSLLKLFHSQIINSLELNFQAIAKQESNLQTIISKLKKSNHLYFFTNKNSEKIVEDFAKNLENLGFEVSIIVDLVKISEKIANFHHKDLFFYIFDDYKNRPLANLAQHFPYPEQQIIISKVNHHHLKNITSLQYAMDYSYFHSLSMVNTRKIILVATLDIIFQTIVQGINHNYQKIVKQFEES